MGVGRAHGALCHSLCRAILTEIFPLHRVFKTPGLRTPAARERIYNVSVNGSPLADSREVFLTVPVGGGEVSVSQGGWATMSSSLGISFLGPSPTPHPHSPLGCMGPDAHTSTGLRTRFLAQAGLLARLRVPFVHQLTFAHLRCGSPHV